MNDLDLTAQERAQLSQTFGASRAAEITTLAREKLSRPPAGELSTQRDPAASGTGKFYSQVEDPRSSGIKRLTVLDMEKLALDPQIALGIEMHRLPLLTLKPQFQHSDEKIAVFLNHELERFGWVKLGRQLLLALEYGFYTAERVYGSLETTLSLADGSEFKLDAVVYDKLKGIHPSAVQLDVSVAGEYEGFTQTAGASKDGGKIPEGKALIYSYDERFGNRYGNPLSRRAYKFWWWGELIYQFANRYHEDQAVPPRKVFYEPNPQAVDPTDPNSPIVDNAMKTALEIAEKTRAGSGAAFPLQQEVTAEGGVRHSRGWDMEYLTGPNKATEFTTYLDHLDAKKLRALFVPEKLAQSSSGGGSYAMVESLAEFFLMSMEAHAAELYAFLISDWARPLIRYNFGSAAPDATLPAPKLSRDNRAFLQGFMTQFYGGLLSADPANTPRVDIEALANDLGVPMLETPVADVISQGTEDEALGDVAPLTDAAPISADPFQAAKRAVRPVQTLDTLIPGTRKATNNKPWEAGTKAFQEALGEAYNAWQRQTSSLLAAASADEQQAVLDAQLATLKTALVKRYRSSIPEARGLGYGLENSPASLEKLAKSLEKLETKLAARITVEIGSKVARDLSELGRAASAADIAGAIALRLKAGIITPAGNDYWHTIVDGWTDKRLEREADPSIQQGALRWVLDPLVKNHCDDCLSRAGEYDSIRDLPSIPGDGNTECGIYCYCWLEEEDAAGNWQRRISDL